ncbi:MAG: EboA domain-containing protein [Verrucomicrobiales bacterium]|nr:EboA domain-containing protein [Verrucomicrobiae bacterium]
MRTSALESTPRFHYGQLMESPYELLLGALEPTASLDAVRWLRGECTRLSRQFEENPFFFAFSGVSRHFDRTAEVTFSKGTAEVLQRLIPGLCLKHWDEFRTARTVLIGLLLTLDRPDRLRTLERLTSSADIREQIAIFGALPLLPNPEDLVELARDGLRTNILSVFDAIALRNPFPERHFTEEGWNQMVLKALFLGRPLHRVVGLDARANPALAEAVNYLAHERWSAGRKISPEAWRCCSGFVSDQIAHDLKRVAASPDRGDREAAALLAVGDTTGRLAPIREALPAECADVAKGSLTWDSLGALLATPV